MRSPAAAATLLLALSACTSRTPTQVATVVPVGPPGQPYVALLHGSPQTVSMESGVVALAPHASVGVHDSEQYEEVLVPLEGQGELRIDGRPPLALSPQVVAYTPPHTRHDVVNIGDAQFRYIYVAARAR